MPWNTSSVSSATGTAACSFHKCKHKHYTDMNDKTQHEPTDELLPVVDENGNVQDAATRAECHGGSMLLHPVVHLHLFNSAGALFLQKRPQWKTIQPGKWDTAVGGHVDFGESVEQALRREAREEIGVTDFTPERLPHYVFQSDVERELVFPHKTVYDGEVKPSDETDGGRFWTKDEIEASLGKGVFTPNFEKEYERLSALLYH